MTEQKTTKFLSKSIAALPNDAQFDAIRSHMMVKLYYRAKESLTNVARCIACGVDFNEILPFVKIGPAHAISRFAKRNLQKNQHRTKYQVTYNKKFLRSNIHHQRLITVCQRCSKRYIKPFLKTKIIPPKLDVVLSEVAPKPKKNKKGKTKLAGLKKCAVNAAKIQQKLNKKANKNNASFADSESPNYLSLNTDDDCIIIDDTPKMSNDSVIILDTPKVSKKTKKKSNKFDPTNYTPEIRNNYLM